MKMQYEPKVHDSFGVFLKESSKLRKKESKYSTVEVKKGPQSSTIEVLTGATSVAQGDINRVLIKLLDGPVQYKKLSLLLNIGIFSLSKILSKLSIAKTITIDQKSDIITLTEIGKIVAQIQKNTF